MLINIVSQTHYMARLLPSLLYSHFVKHHRTQYKQSQILCSKLVLLL